jgi:tRNA wybutosine-synthesizing protein 4
VGRAVFECAGFEAGVPTLVLSECVLIYLAPERSDALIAWLRHAFACAAMMVYEQIRPHDAFGRQMVQNIQDRGCPLLGIHAYPDLADQERRFRDAGWTGVVALDMNAVYRNKLDPADVRRIERLEIFDEFEEWNLIQAHYCIVVATIGGGEGGWPTWSSLEWLQNK